MTWTLEALTGQTETHLISFEGLKLHPEIKTDFIALKNAAKQAGFTLGIASGFRSFERQKMIWNNKFLGLRPLLDDQGNTLNPHLLNEEEKIKAILRWSALPGASRHHWGTDLDVYAINHLPPKTELQLEPWEYLTGHQATFFQWLKKNSPANGFYFPYEKDLGGVAFEPWHISHKNATAPLLKQLTPETLRKVISCEVQGQKWILNKMDWIYDRYIANVSKG